MPFEPSDSGLPPVEVPDWDHMGPAMRALNEKQRRFVCALAIFGGDQSRAYAWAGYNVKTDNAARACASRLIHTEQIKAAIKEEAHRRLDYSGLLAVSTIIELASPTNGDQKTRLKAATELADRTGFHAKSEHKVVVEDSRTVGELKDFIMNKLAERGIDPQKYLALTGKAPESAGEVIDAQYEEVDDDLKDLIG